MNVPNSSPTLDDVASAVFASLDVALLDGLEEYAIEHMTLVFDRDIDLAPYEQRLAVAGRMYRIHVEAID